MTVLELYKLFLGRIQKKSTRSVWPTDFNRLVNIAYDEWLTNKIEEVDLDQKRIDDLSALRVVLDSTIEVLISMVSTSPIGGEIDSDTYDPITGIRIVVVVGATIDTYTYQRLIPIVPDSFGYFSIPSNYPEYHRLLSSSLVVTKDSVDYEIYCKALKSDLKSSIMIKNPFRKPMLDVDNNERSRVYIQDMNGKIKVFAPSGATVKNLTLEYIKRPKNIYLDVNGNNSVDCELDRIRQGQIASIAVRKFLEETENERYKTDLAEVQIENISN